MSEEILKDGESCSYGCERHINHPCENCGRTQARGTCVRNYKNMWEIVKTRKDILKGGKWDIKKM